MAIFKVTVLLLRIHLIISTSVRFSRSISGILFLELILPFALRNQYFNCDVSVITFFTFSYENTTICHG